MISFEEALGIVRAHRWQSGSEMVGLDKSIGRRLAESVFAELDAPSYTSSAMDGFAVGSLEGPWSIIGAAPAGAIGPTIGAGQAVRINTGSLVPSGTVAVIPQEDAEVLDDQLRSQSPRAGAHIRQQGEEFKSGSLLVPAGTRITPPVISALASQGVKCVSVGSIPRVALLSTGRELLSPGEPYIPGRVYDSNSAGIAPLLERMGCAVTKMTVTDDADSTAGAIRGLLDQHDLIITIGGVSVGDFDFVRPAVTENGFTIEFSGVAIKPGKPISFGIREDGKTWFGLPGNPMSALVTFCLFAMDYLGDPMKFRPYKLLDGISRRAGREEFIPAHLPPGSDTILMSPPVGSHAISGLTFATGLARVSAEIASLSSGDVVQYAPLPWGGYR